MTKSVCTDVRHLFLKICVFLKIEVMQWTCAKCRTRRGYDRDSCSWILRKQVKFDSHFMLPRRKTKKHFNDGVLSVLYMQAFWGGGGGGRVSTVCTSYL